MYACWEQFILVVRGYRGAKRVVFFGARRPLNLSEVAGFGKSTFTTPDKLRNTGNAAPQRMICG